MPIFTGFGATANHVELSPVKHEEPYGQSSCQYNAGEIAITAEKLAGDVVDFTLAGNVLLAEPFIAREALEVLFASAPKLKHLTLKGMMDSKAVDWFLQQTLEGRFPELETLTLQQVALPQMPLEKYFSKLPAVMARPKITEVSVHCFDEEAYGDLLHAVDGFVAEEGDASLNNLPVDILQAALRKEGCCKLSVFHPDPRKLSPGGINIFPENVTIDKAESLTAQFERFAASLAWNFDGCISYIVSSLQLHEIAPEAGQTIQALAGRLLAKQAECGSRPPARRRTSLLDLQQRRSSLPLEDKAALMHHSIELIAEGKFPEVVCIVAAVFFQGFDWQYQSGTGAIKTDNTCTPAAFDQLEQVEGFPRVERSGTGHLLIKPENVADAIHAFEIFGQERAESPVVAASG